ncbi:MAG: DNA repair protein RadC [Flavobacteriaceae bacterium]|nr:DNA repair protein RadC [Flavobacteriaceae bacterium]
MIKNLSTLKHFQDNTSNLQNLQQKLLLRGKNAMNDSELLVIVLGNGKKTPKSKSLGSRVWQFCQGNLYALGRMTLEELLCVEGLGISGALTLAAAFELGKRRVIEEPLSKQIRSSSDALHILLPLYLDVVVESFNVVYLNRANRIVRLECVSLGGLTGTVVDVRMVFKRALELRASGLLLSHNHPSGNVQPSECDIRLTSQFIQAGKLFDISIIDHVIVAGNRSFSFVEQGVMPYSK